MRFQGAQYAAQMQIEVCIARVWKFERGYDILNAARETPDDVLRARDLAGWDKQLAGL